MTGRNDRPGRAADLRQRAEALAREKAAPAPEKLEVPTPADARRMVHELQVHQIELEMQNEELRRAQGELEAARARYFDLYDLAPVGYVTVGEPGLILEANLTAANLLGLARGNLVKQPLSRFIHREDLDRYRLHRKQLLKTGNPQTLELRLVKKDGTAFWAHLETAVEPAPATGAGREIESNRVCRVMVSDISGRKRADDALLASEARFRSIINASPVPMALNDEQQRITFLNPAFIQTFGYTPAEIPTLAAWWPRAYPDPEYRRWAAKSWQAELERAKMTATAFSPMELRVRCKDGTDKTILASAASVSGSYAGDHLVVLYDITERKQLAEKAARLEAHLRQAQKVEAIGQLAGAWRTTSTTSLRSSSATRRCSWARSARKIPRENTWSRSRRPAGARPR